MTQEEYLKDRVEDQIKWYGDKSSACQKKYKMWQVIKIIAALLITTLSLWISSEEKIETISLWFFHINMPQVIGIIGAFIIFIESFVKIYDYKKLWVQYRLTSEKLNREKLMFETKSAPYNATEPFILLVQRCEAIMQNENQGWEDVLAEEDNT